MPSEHISSANCVNIKYEDLRVLAFGGIGAGFVLVGTNFANPVRQIRIWNTTDANLIISYDGVNNKDFIPAKTGMINDYGSNKAQQGGFLEQSAGEGVWVKQEAGAPTLGNVYVTVIYAGNN